MEGSIRVLVSTFLGGVGVRVGPSRSGSGGGDPRGTWRRAPVGLIHQGRGWGGAAVLARPLELLALGAVPSELVVITPGPPSKTYKDHG